MKKATHKKNAKLFVKRIGLAMKRDLFQQMEAARKKKNQSKATFAREAIELHARRA